VPGDISKHTKYIVNLPYPEPRVEKTSIGYANVLLKDYAGEVSEFTAVSLYVYQHIVSEGRFEDYARIIGGISMAEMKHLELIGKTVKLLGIKPIYIDSACPPGQLWTSAYVNFTIFIKDMLLEDIKSEKKAIKNYKYHISIIKDRYIQELIKRIIKDEELHLKLFTELYGKYSAAQ